jgi:hypothetical protein
MAKQANSESSPIWILIVLAVVAAVASVWALSLRGENARLRARVATLTASAGAPADQAAAPAAAPTPAAPEAPSAPPGPNRLTDEVRATMRAKLPPTTPLVSRVWFAVSSDPEAQALATDIQDLFKQAGWDVVSAPATFNVRPGIFVFAADESPPSMAEDALKALQAGGFAPTVGLGYRSFYEEKKRTDPNWRGVELAAEQSFVIVIGPR